ncbi:MAG: hypothetical protein WAX04_02505 [Oscillospiraceae bacterium]
MKMTETIEKDRKNTTVISIVLGIAVIASTSAYLIFKFVSERTYRRKWKDYDDCGLA